MLGPGYLNSGVQCLSHTTLLRQKLLETDESDGATCRRESDANRRRSGGSQRVALFTTVTDLVERKAHECFFFFLARLRSLAKVTLSPIDMEPDVREFLEDRFPFAANVRLRLFIGERVCLKIAIVDSSDSKGVCPNSTCLAPQGLQRRGAGLVGCGVSSTWHAEGWAKRRAFVDGKRFLSTCQMLWHLSLPAAIQDRASPF